MQRLFLKRRNDPLMRLIQNDGALGAQLTDDR
jgi:hypothetical protein